MDNQITDEQVKRIFNDTYKLYEEYKAFSLFQTLITVLTLAKEETVLPIMTDIAKLFKKYKDVYKDEDWCELCKEAKQLNAKYKNNDLANQILVEILNILEKRYTSKKK